MATSTYTPIASITLGSSASSVTFSSIPQDYRDLVLVCSYQISTDDVLLCRINGDSGSNYPRVLMGGNGSTEFTTASTETSIRALFGQSGITNSAILQFMDYSATDKHKTILGRGNAVTAEVTASATRFANTNAVSSLLLTGTIDFNTGSTFALWGIAS